MPGVGAVILAAGASTRLGTPKQLLHFRGQTLLHLSIKKAIEARCSPVVVTLGAAADDLLPAVRKTSANAVYNPHWERGMGTSIRAGVQRLIALSPELSAVVILLVDQPLVSAAVLRQLIDDRQQQDKPVAACAYGGTIGPPVCIGWELFPQLLSLPDHQGAKALWQAHPDWVHAVACEEAATDVDTPEDYQRLPP